MRKLFLLFTLLIVALTSYCAQDEYVIVRIGDQTTVYSTFTSGNYTGISEMKGDNLTIENLENFGLPKNLWPEVSGSNGVFDTRLEAAKVTIDELNSVIDTQSYRIREEQSNVRNFITSSVILIFLLIVVVIAYFAKK